MNVTIVPRIRVPDSYITEMKRHVKTLVDILNLKQSILIVITVDIGHPNWKASHTYYGIGHPYPHKILINPYDISLADAMSHEFRHAWQFENGIMSQAGDKRLWNGEPVETGFNSMSTKEYNDLPWEVDALDFQNRYVNLRYKTLTKA